MSIAHVFNVSACEFYAWSLFIANLNILQIFGWFLNENCQIYPQISSKLIILYIKILPLKITDQTQNSLAERSKMIHDFPQRSKSSTTTVAAIRIEYMKTNVWIHFDKKCNRSRDLTTTKKEQMQNQTRSPTKSKNKTGTNFKLLLTIYFFSSIIIKFDKSIVSHLFVSLVDNTCFFYSFYLLIFFISFFNIHI